MAPGDFIDDEIALASAVELSAIYAEAADELRLAIQKPGLSRDQLARLLLMACSHLDGASSTIDTMARHMGPYPKGKLPMAPNEQSPKAGLWEHQARESINRARLQGFLIGFFTMGIAALIFLATGWS